MSKCQLKGAQFLHLACQEGGSPPCSSVNYATALTLDTRYLSSLGSSLVIEIQTYARTGVPNLFLAMYPFSISTDEYVSLNLWQKE